MKTIYKILAVIVLAGLWACEKNDPLADQGDLTGHVVPFILLAQMPDAPAGDTITLRALSWAVDDDISQISLYHRGFKLQTYEVKIRAEGDDVTHELSVTMQADSIIIPETLIDQYPKEGESLNDYYQTYENAYVILHDFMVPMGYALNKERDGELILAMPESAYQMLVAHFSTMFYRALMVAVFPDINPFSVVYFEVDDGGFFTGALTDEGMAYVREHLGRELMIEILHEARVADNTRVTVRANAIIDPAHEGKSSERTFRVL